MTKRGERIVLGIGIIALVVLLWGTAGWCLDSFDQPLADERECCSWHYGIWYCDHEAGYLMCRDGEYSPTCECTCDADEDGYMWTWDYCWVEAEQGYVGDCDDDNAWVFPGAPELPDNGVDDDCDGEVDEVEPVCFLRMVG